MSTKVITFYNMDFIFYLAESSTEYKEDIKPSLFSNFPQDSPWKMRYDLTKTRQENMQPDGMSNFEIPSLNDAKPIVIAPCTEDSGSQKDQTSVSGKSTLDNTNNTFISSEAKIMKLKTQKIMKVVPSVLAKSYYNWNFASGCLSGNYSAVSRPIGTKLCRQVGDGPT